MSNEIYIGLMSGTSLDGVDGVMVALPAGGQPELLAAAYRPFSDALRRQALALQAPGVDEIEREALLGNALAQCYAACVQDLRQQAPDAVVKALGVHGQTIRHRPERGYTRQTNNPALLAELCGLDVIADFRSRDIAAGGQGAPLVPAFHRALFGQPGVCRVVANIGGIGNISILWADGRTSGFDTGPGNVLMDAWIARHQGQAYDKNGAWAAYGAVDQALLADLLDEPYLRQPPPKSTGRDLFHLAWLDEKLNNFPACSAIDVQATLCAYTAATLAQAIAAYAPDAVQVLVCGGGAFNIRLMQDLQLALQQQACAALVGSTAELGVAPQQVEALAFAWLAQRFLHRQPGNLPEVTGAQGLRVLGALYPA